MHAFGLCLPLLLPNLQLPLLQYNQHDLIARLAREGLFEVLIGCDLAFRNVEEDVGDLQDVVEVLFRTGAIFEDFVFIARDFKALFALLYAHERDIC